LAARLFAADEILSSDALRAAISGDAADQRATGPAFALLHREASRRLAAGRLVVVDATNVEGRARRALIRIARAAGVAASAIVIAPPAAVVHARNAGRAGRIVPPDVVDRHLAAVAALGATTAEIGDRLRGEGFATIAVVTTGAEIESLGIVRVAGPPAQPSRTRPNARARSSTQTPFRR
jgi:protein phosphatase